MESLFYLDPQVALRSPEDDVLLLDGVSSLLGVFYHKRI